MLKTKLYQAYTSILFVEVQNVGKSLSSQIRWIVVYKKGFTF